MMDDDLITLVREQRTSIPMPVPVEDVISRGSTLRARRRLRPALAAGVTVAAGAAVAVATLVPGHQAAQPARTQLAAWTVTRGPGGAIDVTFRELRDPAALQATLRADGVPAHVSFSSPRFTGCQGHRPASPGGLQKVYQIAPGDRRSQLIIHPSALPSGAGVGIYVGHVYAGHRQDGFAFSLTLVQISPQCTG